MKSELSACLLRQERRSQKLSILIVVEYLNNYGIQITCEEFYEMETLTGFQNPYIKAALCNLYEISDTDHDKIWHSSEYEDFFNAHERDKIYLLEKWGIPTFFPDHIPLINNDPFFQQYILHGTLLDDIIPDDFNDSINAFLNHYHRISIHAS